MSALWVVARGWWSWAGPPAEGRSEEHTSELQSLRHLVCRRPRSALFPYTTLFRSTGLRLRPTMNRLVTLSMKSAGGPARRVPWSLWAIDPAAGMIAGADVCVVGGGARVVVMGRSSSGGQIGRAHV